MGKRVGTAKWYENQKRWQIKVGRVKIFSHFSLQALA